MKFQPSPSLSLSLSLSPSLSLSLTHSHAKAIIGGFSFNTYTYLYNTLVAPIMEYSSCIWGFEQHDCLELVQNRALRFFLGVGRNYPRAALQGEMGWTPASNRLNCQLISWWLKINTLEENRLSRLVIEWSMRVAENYQLKNWCWQVRKILIHLRSNVALDYTHTQTSNCLASIIAL